MFPFHWSSDPLDGETKMNTPQWDWLITDVDNSGLWGFSLSSSAAVTHTICTWKTNVHSVL